MSTKPPPPGPRSLDEAIVDDVRAERLESLYGPDSLEGTDLGPNVGANLARLRSQRGLSLDRVAKLSGVDQALLEGLERGDVLPSMRAIWHLATALRVPFGALLEGDGDEPQPDFRVQRASDGRIVASSNDAFRSRILFSEGDPRMPEVYELTLAPGCLEVAAPHAPDTFEHITVIAGELVIAVADDEARLGPGDVIFFRADRPHRYHNPGPEPVLAHLIVRFA